jgi:site-specific DNA-methyltransferase (adenine-specific)
MDTPVVVASADALSWLRALPDSSANLIVTDPPWDSLEVHRSRGTTTRLTNEWFETMTIEDIREVLVEAYRVAAPGTHMYVIADYISAFRLEPHKLTPWHFWKGLVWDKVSLGMGYHYRAQYEMVLLFEKNKSRRQLHNRSVPDVIRSRKLKGKGLYPTEKPVELLELFVLQSSDPGELVIDPFTGSGSTGDAALGLGRRFLGTDIRQEARDCAEKRFSAIIEPRPALEG